MSGTWMSLLGCWRTAPVMVAVAVMVAAISRAVLVMSPAASLPPGDRTKEFLLDLDSDTENVNKTPISNYKVSPTLLPSVSEFKNLLTILLSSS